MKRIGLYLFTQDCRVQDNDALYLLASSVDTLICLYCVAPQTRYDKQFSQTTASEAQKGYLKSTLQGLQNSLAQLGQTLNVEYGDRRGVIADYISRFEITHVASSIPVAYNESHMWQWLKSTFSHVNFQTANNSQIYYRTQLPFDLAELPKSFSSFRKFIERDAQCERTETIPQRPCFHLPPPPCLMQFKLPKYLINTQNNDYYGGEENAQKHLRGYFNSDAASGYKQTRNALHGNHFSTLFSPYLAHGALSPQQVLRALNEYENQHGSNESTYWIYFELLWREYFHWYSQLHQSALFKFTGITNTKPLTSFYPQRFAAWCNGNTPEPLINALINELNKTGWISNRGRQIIASYLVNELQVDWRYGAAYFEQRLIDYDVASNWGNWQYIAGVGADTKGGRHFNIQKQVRLYDPDGEYTRQWSPTKTQSTSRNLAEYTDMTGWPNEQSRSL
ncbi:deoxyribodipyrimidine photo-lyase [Pseudoalteromonas citrea]|uniref:Cryptochrome DASH n=2 Tax=Pseudoalteromonas citrea TaxID=43655 RepID=A0AAD4ALF6_9GAMM|nr:DASH family cryptochrome [Pseudoalteromonas citrea]KAF7774493.1 deoxyribodipyrimidine photo-lyase [Pseudoalteromonas citrea]